MCPTALSSSSSSRRSRRLQTRVVDPQPSAAAPSLHPVLSIPAVLSAPLARLGLPPSPDPHRLAGVFLPAPSTPVSPVLARPLPLARLGIPPASDPVVSPASSSTPSSRFPSSLDAIVSRPLRSLVSAFLLLLIPVVSPPSSSTPSSLEPAARSCRLRPSHPRRLADPVVLKPEWWIPSPRRRHPPPIPVLSLPRHRSSPTLARLAAGRLIPVFSSASPSSAPSSPCLMGGSPALGGGTPFPSCCRPRPHPRPLDPERRARPSL